MEETSLDDFVTSDRAAAEAEGAVERGADSSESAPGARAGDASPGVDARRSEHPTVTAAWSDEAESCGACGEPSVWRWTQDGTMVCPDCKEW